MGSPRWWLNYANALASQLTPTAQGVVEDDCSFIVERGVLKVALGDTGGWPADRVRCGLVMGAVQSGKTASMFGVAAKALDAGVDIIVVLCGTRVSLWQQTFERFQGQLDLDLPAVQRERARILRPRVGSSSRSLDTLYEVGKAKVRGARKGSQPAPLIFFALKNADHLQALAKNLRTNVFPVMGTNAFHMLVLDDEADDGSVLDAAVEASEDPVFGKLKQIPRSIAKLWAPSAGTAGLHATYVAYTATPQANFLQTDHTPLAPEDDFVVSLRTPSDSGHRSPRSTTYREPLGLSNMYTGGEVFYRQGRAASLCVDTAGDPGADMICGIRAFLVAAAARYLSQPGKLGPDSARATTFDTDVEANQKCTAPSSMLIHPSANISHHRQVAVDLLSWNKGRSHGAAEEALNSAFAGLPSTVLADLEANEPQWQQWLHSYQSSADALAQQFVGSKRSLVPSWESVKEALVSEIIPGTRVSVINSHPESDDRPNYLPYQEQNHWFAPRDLCTIFVSGNVMSRGITLEGLTTTLFLRESNQPMADTQMQMQRWFGYRGKYLHLCRLMTSPEQRSLFEQFHDNDEALRRCVVQEMNDPTQGASILAVLQGREFVATGKIANLGSVPLLPGPKPFVRISNPGSEQDPNVNVIARVFSQQASTDLSQSQTLRGRIAKDPLSLLEAAEMLASLRYTNYHPSPTSRVARLWGNVHARVKEHSPGSVPANFYDVPSVPTGMAASAERVDCPFAIAAYLRLWDACLSRHVRGLLASDENASLWSLADLQLKTAQQPRFWVGIRYGQSQPVTTGPLAELGFTIAATSRQVRDGQSDTWGSRKPTADPTEYRGDDFFDYYHHQAPVRTGSVWRPPGSDGQILFFINQPPHQPFPTVSVGVCVPAGGPDQIAAAVPTSAAV